MNASADTSDPDLPSELRFHAPQPEDIAWAKPILLAEQRMGCEFCFGNVYAWAEKQDTEIAQAGGFFLSRCSPWKEDGDGRKIYCLPQGPGVLN